MIAVVTDEVVWSEPLARRIALGRADGRCELCDRAAPLDYSHRLDLSKCAASQRWAPCNGLALCRPCHEWCHRNALRARRGGWRLSVGDDPTLAATWLHAGTDGRWFVVSSSGLLVPDDNAPEVPEWASPTHRNPPNALTSDTSVVTVYTPSDTEGH